MPGFDFSGLQQIADRVLHNADESVRGLSRLATDTKPVQIQTYDQSGNLVTHNVETIPMQKQKIDNWITGARREYGGIRISPNQTGIITDPTTQILPDGWGSGSRALDTAAGESVSSSVVWYFQAGNPNAQPFQAEVDAFYQDIGISKPSWFWRGINVIEITWSGLQSEFIFFNFTASRGGAISHGAFIKRIQGSIGTSSWGGTDDASLPIGQWKFCGGTHGRGILESYTHRNLRLVPPAGKIQIIAPAIVIGGYADEHWNLYPDFNGLFS